MDALPLLQFLTQHRNYLIAFAILAPIVFFLRVLGAAPDMPIAVFFTIYLAGAFCALLLLLQLIAYLNELLASVRLGKASLSNLTLHQRAILAYIKSRGNRRFADENYATLRELIPLGLIASSHPNTTSDQVSHATFTVPMLVWRAINDPEWNGGPTPDGPPWTSEWMMANLGPGTNWGRNRA